MNINTHTNIHAYIHTYVCIRMYACTSSIFVRVRVCGVNICNIYVDML